MNDDLVAAGLLLVFIGLLALLVEAKRLQDMLRPLLDSRVVQAISAI